MKQISSLLAAIALLLLCGGCVESTKIKAERGNAHAQWELGYKYFFGDGVPLDDVWKR